jgi:type III restriction enzyme
VILEVKGFESEQDRQKEIAAKRWIKAVNHHGEFGKWAFVLCKDPQKLKENLRAIA